VPAHAERFDGEDLVFLRDLLARREMEAPMRGELLRRAARHFGERLDLPLDDELDARKAERMLRELYLFLRETRRAYSSSG
jgi:hypothetical protein